MMALSDLDLYLFLSSWCLLLNAPNTEAVPARMLPKLCRQPALALLLGSQCDSYIQIDVDCVVSSWTSWTSHYENECIEKRVRYIQKMQRNNGTSCPNDLAEEKPCNHIFALTP
jgi:hypothetical protein